MAKFKPSAKLKFGTLDQNVCANCTVRRVFKVTISALVALEQYGDNEVIAFAVRGSVIEVVLMEKE